MTAEKKTKPRKSELKRVPLDRKRIAETALALIDEHGIEQLTMRSLGRALDVEAMALYHHFSSKAELLDGILDSLLDDVEHNIPDDGTPLQRIRATFCAMRALAIAHPHVFLAMVSRRFRTLRALQFYERLLRSFNAAGLNAEQSAAYYRLLANFTIGAGIAEVGSRAQQPEDAPAVLEEFYEPGAFPMVTDIVPYLRVDLLEGIFQSGLDLLLEQLQRQVETTAA